MEAGAIETAVSHRDNWSRLVSIEVQGLGKTKRQGRPKVR